MSKKLKTSSRISVDSISEVISSYPYIYRLMKSQLESMNDLNSPPLKDQVNPIINQLDCYGSDNCMQCKNLLDGMNRILKRIISQNFLNQDNLLKKLVLANNDRNYRSIESEVLLANFFIMNGISILEYEPEGKNNKRADFKISLDGQEIMAELVTPNHPSDDYIEKERSLVERLIRIKSGLLIEISGFELYDRSTLWDQKVEAPSYKHIEEIVTNFRKQATNISSEQLPMELTLCDDYPNIKITILEKIPNSSSTHIFSGASRTGEIFPLKRILDMILDERKHLSPDDINFVFVDLRYWNRPWFDLDSPFRQEIINNLKKNKSSRINAVFSYLVNSKNEFSLISRGLLYQEPKESPVFKVAIQPFLTIWSIGNI